MQNRSGFDLKGKVKFYDRDILIGETDFAALSGRLIESWADWQASAGEHGVYAITDSIQKSEPGKEFEPVILVFNSSPRDNFFADLDTDKDGLGNLKDDNDDNDSFSDKEDAEPLVFNKRPEPENKPPEPEPISNTPPAILEKMIEVVYEGAKKR